MAKKVNKEELPLNWYIITCSNGNEDTVIKNLKAKVKAMHFDDLITDAKIIKSREIIDDFFDDKNPLKLPPKSMRNSITTKWKTLGDGKYQKVKIIDRNKFPGYIYVKMVMNDDTWYAVRNAQNISGLVGSSGKGAKPLPITYDEEMLLSGESDDPSIRVLVTSNAIIEMDRERFDENGKLIGFDDNKKTASSEDKDVEVNVLKQEKDLSSSSRLIDDSEQKLDYDINEANLPKFKIGHTVSILNGEYIDAEGGVVDLTDSETANVTGTIIELDDESHTATVEIDFLGKLTNVVIDYKKIKLVD